MNTCINVYFYVWEAITQVYYAYKSFLQEHTGNTNTSNLHYDNLTRFVSTGYPMNLDITC